MSEQRGTLEILACEIGLALGSLEGALTPDHFAALLLGAGLDAAPDLTGDAVFMQRIDSAALRAQALSAAVDALRAARASGDDAAALQAVSSLITSIGDLATALKALADDFARATAALPNAAALKALALDLVALLLGDAVVAYLDVAHPFLRRILSVLSVIEIDTTLLDEFGFDAPVVRRRLHLDRLGRVLGDPGSIFRDAYGWGTDTFDAAALFATARDVFDVMQPIAIATPDDDIAPADLDLFGFRVRASTTLAPPGLETDLFANPASHTDLTLVQFSDAVRIALQVDGTLADGLTLTLQPPSTFGVKAAGGVAAQAAVKILGTSAARESFVLIGGGASGLRATQLSAGLAADLRFDAGTQKAAADLRFEARLVGGELLIDRADFDGFLASIIPADGVHARFDVGLTLSQARGLSFDGTAALDLTLPLAVSLGPLSLSSAHVGIAVAGSGLQLELAITATVSIGTVHASIARIGLDAALTFPDGGGNLGVADLSIGFQPPRGAGIAIDTGGILTGGGFLFHDEAQKLYSGALQLSLHERITLNAFGLIATKMPDGSRGYSMIVFITAEGFQPIQLGMGFTLSGIGGMVAIHRTFDEDVLRAGLKNDTLGALLFPRDPVGNAPALINALAAAFPAKQGSYLLGLLVRIGWFTPPLVLLDLALILEFGARTRLLVLGRISALLPSPDNDLVRLILDSMGVLDFDQGTASIDAVLVDSRLAHKFALTGVMALRARWSSGPGSGFILAVGGLNPHFAPLEGLPALQRVGIALSSGDNPRLTCDAYFAITSNTVQFGAHAQLYAAAYGFSVEGDIGFDVLIQIAPLHFIADFNAKVQLKHGSSNLFMVSVDGELEGPRPLRVSGKASFSIFWCDFTVRFDKTLVDGEAPPPPPAIDVLAQLKAALASPQSWTAQRAQGHTQGVALRALPPSSTQLVLDPLGRLLVMQQVVPLNTGRDIETFGGAPVNGARRFQLKATLNGTTQHTDTVQDQFAPANFFELSDDEKLAAPSFETMDAGLIFGDDAVSFDASQLIAAPLQYEQIVIDDLAAPLPPPEQAPPKQTYTLRADKLLALSKSGAAARAPIRTAGPARFRAVDASSAATLQPPVWRIVPLADGQPATLDPAVKTWSEHLAALTTLNRATASWQIVPMHELTDR